MKKTLLLLTVVMFLVANSFAQKTQKELKKDIKEKASKNARKEEKKLKKEGWDVAPGSIPLAKVLDKAWEMTYQVNETGQPKYMSADGNGVAQSKSGAETQAMELAKLQLAGQLQQNIAALTTANIGNSQTSNVDAATVTEVIQSAKNIISAKLGRIDPVFKIYRSYETYKKLTKGTVEVQVRIFYDKDQAELQAKEVIKEQLKKKTQANEEELKKLMGM